MKNAKKKQTPNHLTAAQYINYLEKFGLRDTNPIAFTTGNDPRDQHYVRQTNGQPTRITHRVNKLKQAWGV